MKEKEVRHSPVFALCMVAAMANIEPALGHLEKLGDSLEAKQYLYIMPTGELAYLIPALRSIPVPAMGVAGIVLAALALIPALSRLRRKGLDGWSSLGWALVATGACLMAAEYRSRGEWVLFRIGVRYLAMTMLSIGSFLACRDRRYLATLGMGAFTWDISSALFWARLRGDWSATVPVGWYHHFDQEEGRGMPCWLVAVADVAGFAYFAWLYGHDFDPFRLFDR